MLIFTIYGCVHQTDAFFCEGLAKKIAAKVADCEIQLEIFFESDYLVKLEELKKKGCKVMYHKKSHIVLRNGDIIGDAQAFIELAVNEYGIADAEASNTITNNRSVREFTFKMTRDRNRPIVYMKFADSGSKPHETIRLGMIYIELFVELCPLACDNFMKLCVGVGKEPNTLRYKLCPVHRIVKDGWIQTGDIIDGTGANSMAVLNDSGKVPDESFTADFGFAHGGMVGFANDGSHSSGSQFFITMGPCEWMNHNFVGVGKVLQGFQVLRTLNTLSTNNQKPVKNIIIEDCGMAVFD